MVCTKDNSCLVSLTALPVQVQWVYSQITI